MPSNRRENGLDDVDLRLIGELQGDARLSFAELGRRVDLSAPAIAELNAPPAWRTIDILSDLHLG